MKNLFTRPRRKSIPKGILSGILLVLVLGFVFNSALAAEVKLAWDANGETDLAGYHIYKGLQSRVYTSSVSTGKVTSTTLSGLEAGKTYYFAATAYNTSGVESGYSNEVAYRVPDAVPSTWTITASISGSGTISPAGTSTVANGGSLTYTITPASNYKVSDVIIDGTSQGPKSSYTFTAVSTNHTIKAVFAPITWTITASTSGSGTISPAGTSTVANGGSLTYTITPASNYKVSDVLVDGTSQGPKSSYTFSAVSANHTIKAVFAPITWTIKASASGNGTISPSGSITVNQGNDFTFTMSPDSGYFVSDVVIDGISLGDGVSMTFTNVMSNHTIVAYFVAGNQAPLADAGPDQKVCEEDPVTLSGLNSIDPEGNQLAFSWLQLEGPSVQLSDPTSPTPEFQAPVVSFDGASLVFQLTVRDTQGLESADTCIVNVTWVNDPPVAHAGSDQTVHEGNVVSLDSSLSQDPDDGIASCSWTQTGGPAVVLSDVTSPEPFFTAPDVTMDGTALVFQLTVTDLGGLKSQDSCIVNVSWMNEAPVADAGMDLAATSGNLISLDGRNSADSDDGIASFRWNQVSGPPVALSDPMDMSPTFTAPDVSGTTVLEFQLTVTDLGGLCSSDQCLVTIDPPKVYEVKKDWYVIKTTYKRFFRFLTIW